MPDNSVRQDCEVQDRGDGSFDSLYFSDPDCDLRPPTVQELLSWANYDVNHDDSRQAIYTLHKLITSNPEAQSYNIRTQVSDILKRTFDTLIVKGKVNEIEKILSEIDDDTKKDFLDYGLSLELPAEYSGLRTVGIELKLKEELEILCDRVAVGKAPHVDNFIDTLEKAIDCGANIDYEELEEKLKEVDKFFKRVRKEGDKVEGILKSLNPNL